MSRGIQAFPKYDQEFADFFNKQSTPVKLFLFMIVLFCFVGMFMQKNFAPTCIAELDYGSFPHRTMACHLAPCMERN